jgi:HPt (histidine-containing phosphotransfer) domain-containing protein
MKWVFETGKEQTLIPSVYPIQSSNGRSSNERSGAFDLQDLMERVNYDQDLLETIVMMFECDAPAKLSELEIALASHDSLAFEHAAHAIKGMLLNFSARDAADTAFALELLGHSNRWTKAAEWLGNLRQQVDELDIWLNRLLERQAS